MNLIFVSKSMFKCNSNNAFGTHVDIVRILHLLENSCPLFLQQFLSICQNGQNVKLLLPVWEIDVIPVLLSSSVLHPLLMIFPHPFMLSMNPGGQ